MQGVGFAACLPGRAAPQRTGGRWPGAGARSPLLLRAPLCAPRWQVTRWSRGHLTSGLPPPSSPHPSPQRPHTPARAPPCRREQHATPIANVAARWVLQQPAVPAVILGARNARHVPDHQRLFEFELDAADLSAVEALLAAGKAPAGDCYAWERGGAF